MKMRFLQKQRFNWGVPLVILLVMLLPAAITAQVKKDNQLKNKQKLSQQSMDSIAIEFTYMLEEAINEVIKKGIAKEDADELINSTIMPHIRFGAKMQTCSVRDGKCIPNTPTDYKSYFLSIHRRAKKCPNMRVKFLSVRVVDRQPERGRCIVEFIQEYVSCSYSDITPKEVTIHLEIDSDDNTVPKIGHARVK